ncbi:hypothetical protein [Dyadobacter fermentans]|uniref:hypothetical protein n=1 Tax=Dyadobacter fermentans TaxID=94254 RepID=UPI00286E118D|nr:hypothetical protein [Dyadobacter fermentans]
MLIDPYAKALSGDLKWDDALFGYRVGDRSEDLSFNEQDKAPFIPKSVVLDEAFDWENDRRIDRPYHETVIYELHVKGFTQLNEKIPAELRGKYSQPITFRLPQPIFCFLLSIAINSGR